MKMCRIKRDDVVLDIASNDGTLLKSYKKNYKKNWNRSNNKSLKKLY